MTSTEILQQDVKSYAETIEELVSGNCEWFYNDYCDDDDRDEYSGSYARLRKYFEDVMDVEIICDLRGDYRGARIALAIGGPSIYLNTRTGCIEGYWWSARAEWHVRSFAVDAVDAYFKELWHDVH